jgi:hypothetical protein
MKEQKDLNPSKRTQKEEDDILWNLKKELEVYRTKYWNEVKAIHTWRDMEWNMEKKRNEWRLFSIMLVAFIVILKLIRVI